MESLVIGLLFVIVVLLIILVTLVGVNIYLTHKTLVRPEAPCFAGAMQPRFNTVAIEAGDPQYQNILNKLKAKAGMTDDKKPPVGDGNYL